MRKARTDSAGLQHFQKTKLDLHEREGWNALLQPQFKWNQLLTHFSCNLFVAQHGQKIKMIFFLPAFFTYSCCLQYSTMLTPLSGQSIKKNQKQDNDKESENLLSQMYFHLIRVKWKNDLRILYQIIFFLISGVFRHTKGFLITYYKFFLGFCFEIYLCGV